MELGSSNSGSRKKLDYRRYYLALFFSILIFSLAFILSNYFSNLRVDNVRTIQENISLDILSNSAQFDLLTQVPCDKLDPNILSSELAEIGNKLTYTESQRGPNDRAVKYLARYYALLQIKDYSLMKRLAEKCANRKTTFIIYFYSNLTACEDCRKVSAILISLREKYPDLRVYSFSLDSDLSAVRSLKNIYKITGKEVLPILIVEDKVYPGLKTFAELDNLLPAKLKVKATSTLEKTKSSLQ